MPDSKTTFDFDSYKDYLKYKVGPRERRLGVKGAMAKHLRCQPTYVSQVLYGHADLSLEQAEIVSDFFGHSSAEKHYFLLMVQKDRAGTIRLKSYFNELIKEFLDRRLILTERLGAENKLSKDDQSIYYSSWHYAAIHMAVTIPALQTKSALNTHFRISAKRLNDVLDFLHNKDLVRKKGDRFEIGNPNIRLGNSSHNIIKLHTNWRNQAIESLDRETLSDLHYSACVTLSKKDVIRLKDRMLMFIQETVKTIRDSKEEEIYCYNMDFFNLQK